MRRAEDELQKLWRARRGYLAQLRNQVERQLAELTAAEAEPAPPGVQTREARTEQGSALVAESVSDASPMLQELRELPPRPAAPTPSWLDAVDDG